jgi:hypothetical protein
MSEPKNTFKGPTFRYGPNGEAKIFHDSRGVPEGWLDHPGPHEEKPIFNPTTVTKLKLKPKGKSPWPEPTENS